MSVWNVYIPQKKIPVTVARSRQEAPGSSWDHVALLDFPDADIPTAFPTIIFFIAGASSRLHCNKVMSAERFLKKVSTNFVDHNGRLCKTKRHVTSSVNKLLSQPTPAEAAWCKQFSLLKSTASCNGSRDSLVVIKLALLCSAFIP